MRKRATLSLLIAGLALLLVSPGRAQIDVEPDALTHYSYCVSQAKDRNSVFVLDRHILYRCHDDIATSYFNYLGRRHVRDNVAEEPGGVFVYRKISGVGRCWNKIADELGNPISIYGCDVYVDI
jgi:hypothetical protein